MEMIFTEKGLLKYDSINICRICWNQRRKKIIAMNSRYKGSASKACNLRNKQQNTIPVVVYNLSNYEITLTFTEIFIQQEDNNK